MVFYGAAHTLGALTVEGAAAYAGEWFSRGLWGASLSDMTPATSAYWLSVNSFGPPVLLLGLTVLWLDRRGRHAPSLPRVVPGRLDRARPRRVRTWGSVRT
jgi:hypothetical protein